MKYNKWLAIFIGSVSAVVALAAMFGLTVFSVRSELLSSLISNPYTQLLIGYPFGIVLLKVMGKGNNSVEQRHLVASYATCYSLGWLGLMYLWHLSK